MLIHSRRSWLIFLVRWHRHDAFSNSPPSTNDKFLRVFLRDVQNILQRSNLKRTIGPPDNIQHKLSERIQTPGHAFQKPATGARGGPEVLELAGFEEARELGDDRDRLVDLPRLGDEVETREKVGRRDGHERLDEDL